MCAFQNACTKHVVGWQVRADMLGALVTSALHRALLAQRPALPGTTPSLIVHSDQGGQYVSNDYKALLRAAQAQLLAQPTRRVLRQYPTGYDPGRKPAVAPQIKNSKPGSGPSSPTWPMPRPASPTILTITTTSAATPALAIRSHISFTNNSLPISLHSLLLN